MSFYWKQRRLDYNSVAFELQNRIPELKKCNYDDIADHLRGSNLEFYKREKVETSLFIRFTLPFALIFMLILLIGMPINYIISGKWGYRVEWINNWFKSLGFY